MAHLVIADFSPGTGTFVTAESPLAIGFDGAWFAAATGATVAAPAKTREVRSVDELRPRARSSVREPWAAALGKVTYVTKVMKATAKGGVALVETARGPNDIKDLWWCVGSEARIAMRSVPRTSSVELLADGVGLVLDRERRKLIRFHADRAAWLEIELPALVEPEPARGNVRMFAALPQSGVVVIGGAKRCSWMRRDELLALAGSEVTWQVAWTFPGADPDARLTGTVTMCKYGVTNVQFAGAKKQFSGDFRVEVGEPVTLVGKLWDRLGSVQYREIERADGTRSPMPGAPLLVDHATSALATVVPSFDAPAPKLPKKIVAQVAALRAVGLLDEMTPSLLAEYCEGERNPAIVELVLRYYEADRARALRDHYLAHDWRFGQETDDVIAELSALLGEPPLFRQLENARDGIRVAGPRGEEMIAVHGLGDVVDHFNAALAGGTPFGDVRIYGLETGDERHAYFALSAKAFAALCDAKIPFYEA